MGIQLFAIDVEIVMNVHITENVGGGLFAFLLLEPPQSYIQLRLKKVEVIHNFLVQDISYLICVLWYVQIMKTAGNVYASLESVEMSNNVLVLQEENAWNQYALNHFGTLSLGNTEVHFKHTRFCNNS